MKIFLLYTVMVALVAAFGISLFRKWGIIDWVQRNGNDFFAKMFNCEFCLSFWAGLFLSILISIYTGNPYLLFVPICSTVLTRRLL